MLKVISWILVLTLISCGDNEKETFLEPEVWQSEKVVLEYTKDFIPAKSGEKIEEAVFRVPAKIGEDEMAKVAFVFNSKKLTHFKILRVSNTCNKKELKISTRVINLENEDKLIKVGAGFRLQKDTDYAVEVWISSSTCRSIEISLLSWLGNTSTGNLIRTCEAAIGNGLVKFRHTLLKADPIIKLGDYDGNFFDASNFCGEKLRIKGSSCKNKIANFSWECTAVEVNGNRYVFELNYTDGLKSGAYACKKNGNYVQVAHLSACFDTIWEK